MKTNDAIKHSRRRLFRSAGATAICLALGGLPLATRAAGAAAGSHKIGVIGSGKIDGTVAERLVEDAGFESVTVGPLARAKEFDVGTEVFGKGLTAAELHKGLGITP